MNPEISIIIPLYNKENYIKETIKSVLCQSFLKWEMLLIDNGSTDASFDIARQFNDQRIYFFQCLKPGPGAARNYGIKLAKGNWIQFLDADDLLEADHLEQQLKTANKNPEAEIIACSWQEFIDGDSTNKTLKKPTGIEKPIEFLRDATIAFCPWAIHAAIIKQSVLVESCYWNEELDKYLGEDIAFWFKLIDKSKVAYGPNKGALYRTKTPHCRTQLNIDKWFEGVHRAILANLDYLDRKDNIYTPGQCKSLIRLYSGMYLLAQAKNSNCIQSQAINESNKWLSIYFSVSNQHETPMLLRRILGIPWFLKFSNFAYRVTRGLKMRCGNNLRK